MSKKAAKKSDTDQSQRSTTNGAKGSSKNSTENKPENVMTSLAVDESQAAMSASKPPTVKTKSKKTKGRVKIKMEFIENKIRRYTTFSKRKTGIMKKVTLKCHISKLSKLKLVFNVYC